MDAVELRARVRQRTAHDEPPSEERWEVEVGKSYEQARATIRGRLSENEFVVAWYVGR